MDRSETTDALPAPALVAAWLRDRDLRLWPRLDVGQVERLVAALGAGVDPLEGEEVLGILVHSNTERAGCMRTLGAVNHAINPLSWVVRAMQRGGGVDWRYGTLVSDQRVVIRDWLDVVEAPFEAVEDPVASGSVASLFDADRLSLTLDGERVHLGVPAHQALARFLGVVAPEARAGRIRRERLGAPEPEPGDPTGARGFARRMRVDDRRGVALLEAVADGEQTGALDAGAGLDLARRIALHHRMTVYGRGSRDGLWVSVLRPEALRAFFESQLGRPEASEPVDGREAWIFHADRAWSQDAEASRIQLTSGRFAFLRPRTELRVTLEERDHPEGGRWTGYTLEVRVPGQWQPMWAERGHGLVELHLSLLAFEAQLLVRRLVLGPEASVPELLGADALEVDAALRKRAPGARPEWYRQARQWALLHKHLRSGVAPRPELPPGVPGHLAPPPAVLGTPLQVAHIAVTNALAGMLTAVVVSTVYCFGGVGFLMWLEEAVLAQIPGLDEGATAGALLLGLMAQWGGMLLLGPIRFLGALLMLLVPRATGLVGWGLVVLGVVGLLAGDLLGCGAGLLTAWWLTRPAMREYLRA